MDNILKSVKDIEADLHEIRARIAQYKTNVQRATNVRNLYDDDEDFIASLITAIDEVTDDLDTITDDLDMAGKYCDDLVVAVEMEQLSQKVQSC